MSILSYKGGAVVAMTGDECVAVCSDLRYVHMVGKKQR